MITVLIFALLLSGWSHTFTYIGCYFEDPNYPEISSAYISNTPWVSDCIFRCSDLAIPYAAVRGTKCFCTQTFGKYGLGNGTCNLMANDQLEAGGTTSNSIYQIDALDSSWRTPVISLGCYVDTSSGVRDVAPNYWQVNDLTPSRCIQSCLWQGFRFAGVQVGTQCFCGNRFGTYGLDNSGSCSRTCPDGSKCGGIYFNSVFSTFGSISAPNVSVSSGQCLSNPDKNFQGSNVTSAFCSIRCSRLGYSFSGVNQAQNLCSCSNITITSGSCSYVTTNNIASSLTPFTVEFVGCYNENSANRDVSDTFKLTNAVNMTVSDCGSWCASLSFSFAALSNGTDCRCTNSSFATYSLNSTACPINCTTDGLNCGGKNANSIYLIAPVTSPNILRNRYIGCFADNPARDMRDTTRYSFLTMRACLASCAGRGFSFAGYQINSCFCSNTFGHYGMDVTGGICANRLMDSWNGYAGSNWAMSVYFTYGSNANVLSYDGFKVTHNASATTTSDGLALAQYALNLNGATYLGCYKDDSTIRDLPFFPGNSNYPVDCFNLCAGYQLAGLQYGYQCFCGNYTSANSNVTNGQLVYRGRYGKAAGGDATCNNICQSAKLFCGNSVTNSVYDIRGYVASTPPAAISTSQYTYQGCFVDNVDTSATPIFPYPPESIMQWVPSVGSCVKFCGSYSFPFAAVTGGIRCLCAYYLPGSDKRDSVDADCNWQTLDKGLQGGNGQDFTRVAVYRVNSISTLPPPMTTTTTTSRTRTTTSTSTTSSTTTSAIMTSTTTSSSTVNTLPSSSTLSSSTLSSITSTMASSTTTLSYTVSSSTASTSGITSSVLPSTSNIISSTTTSSSNVITGTSSTSDSISTSFSSIMTSTSFAASTTTTTTTTATAEASGLSLDNPAMRVALISLAGISTLLVGVAVVVVIFRRRQRNRLHVTQANNLNKDPSNNNFHNNNNHMGAILGHQSINESRTRLTSNNSGSMPMLQSPSLLQLQQQQPAQFYSNVGAPSSFSAQPQMMMMNPGQMQYSNVINPSQSFTVMQDQNSYNNPNIVYVVAGPPPPTNSQYSASSFNPSGSYQMVQVVGQQQQPIVMAAAAPNSVYSNNSNSINYQASFSSINKDRQ